MGTAGFAGTRGARELSWYNVVAPVTSKQEWNRKCDPQAAVYPPLCENIEMIQDTRYPVANSLKGCVATGDSLPQGQKRLELRGNAFPVRNEVCKK